jgi:uncharacterized protein (DUF1330 family)
MTVYAIAHLQEFTPHRDVAEHIDRIGETFAPFGGRFLIHGTAH